MRNLILQKIRRYERSIELINEMATEYLKKQNHSAVRECDIKIYAYSEFINDLDEIMSQCIK